MEKSKGISLDFMAGSYDRFSLTEKSGFRQRQISFLNLQEGESVLDVGCGPGVLSLLAKKKTGPSGRVVGTDIAPRMIDIARKKAAKYLLDIDFQVASVDALPFPDKSFNVVISSLMFHHLPVAVKKKGLQEIYRVLRTSGRFYLGDFMQPNILTAVLMVPMLVCIEPTRFQLFGKLQPLLREAGFREVRLLKNGFFLKHYLAIK